MASIMSAVQEGALALNAVTVDGLSNWIGSRCITLGSLNSISAQVQSLVWHYFMVKLNLYPFTTMSLY